MSLSSWSDTNCPRLATNSVEQGGWGCCWLGGEGSAGEGRNGRPCGPSVNVGWKRANPNMILLRIVPSPQATQITILNLLSFVSFVSFLFSDYYFSIARAHVTIILAMTKLYSYDVKRSARDYNNITLHYTTHTQQQLINHHKMKFLYNIMVSDTVRRRQLKNKMCKAIIT